MLEQSIIEKSVNKWLALIVLVMKDSTMWLYQLSAFE